MKTISSLENELFGLVFEGGGWRQVVVVGSRGGHGGPPRRSASYRSLPNHGSRGKKKKFADVPLRPLSLVVPASKQPSPMKTSTYTRFRRRRLWCRGWWWAGRPPRRWGRGAWSATFLGLPASFATVPVVRFFVCRGVHRALL